VGGSEGGIKMMSMLDKKSGQRQLWTDLVKQVSGMMGQSFQLPGMTPGASALQQQTFDQAGNYMQGGLPMQGLRNEAIGQYLSGQPAFTVDPAQRDAYFQQAFVDPAQRQFQQQILPQAFERFSGQSMSSPDMMHAIGRASSDFGTGLSAARAGLIDRDITREQAAREAGMGRMSQGLDLGREEVLAPLRFGNALGQQQRGIEGELMREQGMQQIYQQNPMMNPNLQWLTTALQPTKSPVMQQPKAGWGEKIGGIFGLGGIGGAIDSAF
jgi:hypothetical protein